MKKYTLFVVFILVSLWSRAQLSGNSVQLKANGNYISVADASSASLNDTMTLEMMLYFRCNSPQGAMLLTKGWCGSTWSYYFSVYDQKLRFARWNTAQTGCAGNHAIFESSDSIEYNTWTHVAVRIVDLSVEFIINGVNAGSTLISGTNGDGFRPSTQPIRIGSYLNISSVHQSTPLANIDEVRIWHTSRTDAELLAYMNQELTGNETGLKAYYKLNETGSGAGISVANSAAGSSLPNGTSTGTAANLQFTDNSTILNGLPNCDPIAWYKADAGLFADAGITPATNGQAIQQWNDQSGNGYHMSQLNTTEKPTLASTSVNGKPALLFDGNDMLVTLNQINWNSTTNNDIFIVCKSTSPDNMLIESSPSTVTNNGSFYVIDNYTSGGYGVSGALKGTNGSFRAFKNSSGFIPCSKIYQITQDMNLPGTNAIKIKYNNALLADNGGYNSGTPAGGLSNHYLYAGRRSDNTYGLQGHIAEIIVYPYKLTTANAQKVYTYLYQKYFTGTGLSQFNAIPSSNTYSNDNVNDETWKHTCNSSNATQVIASIKDYCLDLGTRSDTVYVEANPVQIGTGYAMRRHYTINTSLNPAGTKRVRLYYTNADFTNLQTMVPGLTSHSQLVVTKYDGPNEDGIFNTTGGSLTFIPSAQITTGTAFGQRYLEFDVSDFSEFWIHAGSVPLPVDILTFHANPCNTQACLQWTVGEEKNVSHYEVERSLDGNSFQFVGKVNATNESSYSFTDNMPYAGRNYYRLNVVDIDGKHNYSPIRSIDFTEGQWNIAILPTFSENGQYTLQSNKSIRSVEIFTTNGSLVQTIHNPSQNLNLSGLSSGMYFIKVSTSAESEVLKVMK